MMIKVIPIIYSLLLATPSIGESTGKGKLGRLRTEDIGVGRKLKEKTAKAAKVCLLHVPCFMLLIEIELILVLKYSMNFHSSGRSWKGKTMP